MYTKDIHASAARLHKSSKTIHRTNAHISFAYDKSENNLFYSSYFISIRVLTFHDRRPFSFCFPFFPLLVIFKCLSFGHCYDYSISMINSFTPCLVLVAVFPCIFSVVALPVRHLSKECARSIFVE